jgi:succinate--hydroxymethylglutarate CoA-transferase
LIAGVDGQRWGTEHPSIVPYQSFRTRDGHIVIGAGNDRQYEKLCTILNRPDLKIFATNVERVENRAKLISELGYTLAKESTNHWTDLLKLSGIPNGPVNSIAQTFNHPQVIHRGMIAEIQHPTAGPIKLVGIPVKYSEANLKIRRPPPLHGEHTDEVLADHGYSKRRIGELRTKIVVK